MFFAGFLHGSLLKNPPASARERHGCDPWFRKIPHVKKQLRLCATAVEPALWSLCSVTREATAVGTLCATTREQPRSPALEKSPGSDRDPAQPKINPYVKVYKKSFFEMGCLKLKANFFIGSVIYSVVPKLIHKILIYNIYAS